MGRNEFLDFSNWFSGEPNNAKGDEDCVHIELAEKSFKWNDDPCSNMLYFVCEQEIKQ